MIRCAIQLVAAVILAIAAAGATPTLEEALAAKEDLWGLAAMQQRNGPSYEFFADLLPPLRYVNTQFRYYPIVLGAPGSAHKARLVSNGSAVNARAGLRTWKEIGAPVSFFVGAEQMPFGGEIGSLDGPRYERGYLPIVQMDYRSGETTYREETFAGVEPGDHAILFTRFILQDGRSGSVAARIAADGPVHIVGNALCDEQERALIWFSPAWQWDAGQKTLSAPLSARHTATLAIATVPLEASAHLARDAFDYEAQKNKCIDKWESILSGAMRVTTPEPVVNAAWKSTIIGSLLLEQGDHMNYSAGNAYQTMYEAESGDAARALLLWGLTNDVRRMIPPLLDYSVDPGLKFHDSGFKLQLLAHYYWLTRDAQFVREQKPRWSRCVAILTRERDAASGLLPREHYCGDEHEKVFSLNANANGWRGLRDLALVLRQIGDAEEAGPINDTADALREATFAAVDKSERRDVKPPFIPVALFGQEKPYDMTTATRRGTYYNLMVPYVIGSGIFGNGSERETSMLRYLEEHGGLCMGMMRIHQHSGLFANEDGVDDLYTLRYADALLRRDEPERALVSFYGKLAQGMTRGTFLSAEGTGLRPLDAFGRPMYLPPISSGDGLFLWLLRSMLVQDYVDNAGEPDTLRLLFATPRRWLADGREIRVEHAPTAFGEVSIWVKSQLKKGEVLAEIEVPARTRPEKMLLRIRLPEGWKIISAKSGSRILAVDDKGTVDISALHGKNTIHFKAGRITSS
jgi:hypothetical protein